MKSGGIVAGSPLSNPNPTPQQSHPGHLKLTPKRQPPPVRPSDRRPHLCRSGAARGFPLTWRRADARFESPCPRYRAYLPGSLPSASSFRADSCRSCRPCLRSAERPNPGPRPRRSARRSCFVCANHRCLGHDSLLSGESQSGCTFTKSDALQALKPVRYNPIILCHIKARTACAQRAQRARALGTSERIW